MVYKAKQDIGQYKAGDTVPEEQAELWLSMYKYPPVELVSGKSKPIEKEEIKEDVIEEDNSDPLLDDYLNQNSYVVRRSIRNDNLSESQIKKLILIEESDKDRKSVIKALKEKLE